MQFALNTEKWLTKPPKLTLDAADKASDHLLAEQAGLQYLLTFTSYNT